MARAQGVPVLPFDLSEQVRMLFEATGKKDLSYLTGGPEEGEVVIGILTDYELAVVAALAFYASEEKDWYRMGCSEATKNPLTILETYLRAMVVARFSYHYDPMELFFRTHPKGGCVVIRDIKIVAPAASLPRAITSVKSGS